MAFDEKTEDGWEILAREREESFQIRAKVDALTTPNFVGWASAVGQMACTEGDVVQRLLSVKPMLGEVLKGAVDELDRDRIFAESILPTAMAAGNVAAVKRCLENMDCVYDLHIPMLQCKSKNKPKSILAYAVECDNEEIFRMIVEKFEFPANRFNKALKIALLFNSMKIANVIKTEALVADEEIRAQTAQGSLARRRSSSFRLLRDQNQAWEDVSSRSDIRAKAEEILLIQNEIVKKVMTALDSSEDREGAVHATIADVDRSEKTRLARLCQELENLHLQIYHDLFDSDIDQERLNAYLSRDIFEKFEESGRVYQAVWANSVVNTNSIRWNRFIAEINRLKHAIKKKASQHGYCQPFTTNSIYDDYAQILMTQQRLHEYLYALSQMTFGVMHFPAAKGLPRWMQKKAKSSWYLESLPDRKNEFYSEYSGTLNRSGWDVCRGMISYDSLQSISSTLGLMDLSSNVNVVNVTNRFAEWEELRSTNEEKQRRWQDVMVHIKFGDARTDIICEIQLTLKSMSIARKNLGGHAVYSLYRSAEELKTNVLQDNEKHKKGCVFCNQIV